KERRRFGDVIRPAGDGVAGMEIGKAVARPFERHEANLCGFRGCIPGGCFQPRAGPTVKVEHWLAFGVAIFGVAEEAAVCELEHLFMGPLARRSSEHGAIVGEAERRAANPRRPAQRAWTAMQIAAQQGAIGSAGAVPSLPRHEEWDRRTA